MLMKMENRPIVYDLQQNYPNPFNPATTITYSIKEAGNVEIKIYDVLGREVVELLNKEMPAGLYKINFKAENLPSGIYYYTLKVNSFAALRKMILLK